tara:strand:+ start:39 stop:1304 length:1266 start_codon:yes stop_codon:yes gene_type:complete
MKIKRSILIEAVRKVIEEQDFDADKFPFPNADKTGKYAKFMAQAGKPEKDKGPANDDEIASDATFTTAASNLNPSQKEIKLGQALGMAISMIGKLPGPFKDGPGGNLGAVISKDNYIMDGHHRWAASIFAAGPEIELGGTKIEMDGEQLVQVLALMGDAFHPGERKKPSPHNIMSATIDDVNNFINKFVEEGIGEFVDAETAKRVLEERFGSIEKAKAHFVSQLKNIQKEPPSWAQSRDKMPVLEPKDDEPEKVAAAMAAGQVDVYEPYAKLDGDEEEEEAANRRDTSISKIRITKEGIRNIVTESLQKSGYIEEYCHIADASYDDGTLAEDVEFWDDALVEAEYQGRKVTLNKPTRGDVKKFKVFVKDPKTGNVKKVNFGDPNMKIRKSNPKARKSFRARHNCDNPGPKTKARYWSCRKW